VKFARPCMYLMVESRSTYLSCNAQDRLRTVRNCKTRQPCYQHIEGRLFPGILWPRMWCWVHEELTNEWEGLVNRPVALIAVRLYWRIIEHPHVCEVCRYDRMAQEMKAVLGQP